MSCIGTFTAQNFKFLSFDPNTIFQFFVYTDSLVALKIGTAVNQIPQALSRGLIKGPVGLGNYAQEGLPSIERARDLIRQTAGGKNTFLPDSGARSREFPFGEIAQVTFKKSLMGRGIQIETTGGEKLFFRFLEPAQESRALDLLTRQLGTRMAR